MMIGDKLRAHTQRNLLPVRRESSKPPQALQHADL